VQADARHAFAQAALFHKILLQPAQLLVNQIISLVDEAKGDVGHHFGRTRLHKLPVVSVGLRLFAAQFADELRFLGIFVPNRKIAGAQEVSVVSQQFLQAGAGNIGQLDFGFRGCERNLATLQDVLLA
jgi:hypothetical protein